MLWLLLNRGRLLKDTELLGRWGERRGEKFLKRKGLRLLTRNYCCKAGEIDLVMVDTDRAIVFVEVKTRADDVFTPTESVVTTPKMDRMARTARYFLSANDIENRPYRFDIVAITVGQKGAAKIRHFKNAFVR